jgi:hypothetical protein
VLAREYKCLYIGAYALAHHAQQKSTPNRKAPPGPAARPRTRRQPRRARQGSNLQPPA